MALYNPSWTNVIHVKDSTGAPDEVYIGRKTPTREASKWANPFRISPKQDRTAVIARHKEWLMNSPELLADIHELEGKTLVCFCRPEDCHGDTLADLANRHPDEDADSDAAMEAYDALMDVAKAKWDDNHSYEYFSMEIQDDAGIIDWVSVDETQGQIISDWMDLGGNIYWLVGSDEEGKPYNRAKGPWVNPKPKLTPQERLAAIPGFSKLNSKPQEAAMTNAMPNSPETEAFMEKARAKIKEMAEDNTVHSTVSQEDNVKSQQEIKDMLEQAEVKPVYAKKHNVTTKKDGSPLVSVKHCKIFYVGLYPNWKDFDKAEMRVPVIIKREYPAFMKHKMAYLLPTAVKYAFVLDNGTKRFFKAIRATTGTVYWTEFTPKEGTQFIMVFDTDKHVGCNGDGCDNCGGFGVVPFTNKTKEV